MSWKHRRQLWSSVILTVITLSSVGSHAGNAEMLRYLQSLEVMDQHRQEQQRLKTLEQQVRELEYQMTLDPELRLGRQKMLQALSGGARIYLYDVVKLLGTTPEKALLVLQDLVATSTAGIYESNGKKFIRLMPR